MAIWGYRMCVWMFVRSKNRTDDWPKPTLKFTNCIENLLFRRISQVYIEHSECGIKNSLGSVKTRSQGKLKAFAFATTFYVESHHLLLTKQASAAALSQVLHFPVQNGTFWKEWNIIMGFLVAISYTKATNTIFGNFEAGKRTDA